MDKSTMLANAIDYLKVYSRLDRMNNIVVSKSVKNLIEDYNLMEGLGCQCCGADVQDEICKDCKEDAKERLSYDK